MFTPGREEERERERKATSIVSPVHFRFSFPDCYTSRGKKDKKGKTAHFSSVTKKKHTHLPPLYFSSQIKKERQKTKGCDGQRFDEACRQKKGKCIHLRT